MRATGHVLIGSEQDLRIDRIEAGGETRIKVAGGLGGLATATDAVNVKSGGRLILEAASAGIGGTLDADGLFLTPFGIQLTSPDAGLILRAGGHAWVAAESGLFVDHGVRARRRPPRRQRLDPRLPAHRAATGARAQPARAQRRAVLAQRRHRLVHQLPSMLRFRARRANLRQHGALRRGRYT